MEATARAIEQLEIIEWRRWADGGHICMKQTGGARKAILLKVEVSQATLSVMRRRRLCGSVTVSESGIQSLLAGLESNSAVLFLTRLTQLTLALSLTQSITWRRRCRRRILTLRGSLHKPEQTAAIRAASLSRHELALALPSTPLQHESGDGDDKFRQARQPES